MRPDRNHVGAVERAERTFNMVTNRQAGLSSITTRVGLFLTLEQTSGGSEDERSSRLLLPPVPSVT